MKPDLYQLSLVLSFLFLFGSSSKLAASSMETRRGPDEVNLNEISETLDELMGLEECVGGGDEECFKRRQISEVHLDYIYTQHHRP